MFITFKNWFLAIGRVSHTKETKKEFPWFDAMSDKQRLEYFRAVKKSAQEQGVIAPRIDAYIASYELLCEDWIIEDEEELV